MLEHESGVLPSMAAIDESIHIGMQPVHQVRAYTGEGGDDGYSYRYRLPYSG